MTAKRQIPRASNVALTVASVDHSPSRQDFDSPEYAAFVAEMATHCRCTRDCPCAGVLAGGLCDGLTDNDRDSLFDDPDEYHDGHEAHI